MRKWGEKPYYSLDFYLKETFGAKGYKVALNAGMTCPNRDHTLGERGCIFCSAGGSGEFAGDPSLSITEQIEQGIANTAKFHAAYYIAYFQAYTNTYAPVEKLSRIFTEAIRHPKIAAISIATRPDCLPEEVIALLACLNRIKPVWVELGLQTIWEETARYIRRGYPLSCFEDSLNRLKKEKIAVIVHVILGLPGESRQMMLDTIEYLNQKEIQGIKLQLLHVLSGTDLAEDFEKGMFSVMEEQEYIDLVVDCIERIAPEIVLHRLTGDGPKDSLIAPLWSTKKMQILNEIHHALKLRNTWQGRIFGR